MLSSQWNFLHYLLVTFSAAVSPKNLKATPGKSSPESSLLVTFTDVQNISSTYKIVAVSQSDGKPLQIETSEQSALLEDLTPGDSYKISAQSFGPAGENFKTSKSCIEQVVQTGIIVFEGLFDYIHSLVVCGYILHSHINKIQVIN